MSSIYRLSSLSQVFLLFIGLAVCTGLQAQDSRLANQYFRSGEYEKAAATYFKLYQQNPAQLYLFDNYVACLLELEEYDKVSKELKNQIKEYPNRTNNYVAYGNLLEKLDKAEEAQKWYRKGIDEMPAEIGVISKVGSTFSRLGKYELALEAYLKGEEMMGKAKFPFETNMAQVYQKLNQPNKMIEYYINYAARQDPSPNRIKSTKTNMKYWLKGDSTYLEEMKTQLYTRIQEEPDKIIYPQLLEWTFIEKEDYKSALRQARALDRMLDENGNRVLTIGEIARKDDDNETAIKAYDYIITKKGVESPLYLTANSNKLKLQEKEAMSRTQIDPAELDSIDVAYQSFMEEMGVNANTDYIIKQYADFLALSKNDMDKAIQVLEDLVILSSIDKSTKSSSKIALADYYLMRGEVWESTLLYSQVDKENEEGLQGEIARFKNAMLFYYEGEFAWAQEQFDILESATSKLISNDAIDMSVFIMDNMGLDTTDIPLKMFAQAEFLTVQNRFDEAFSQLEKISATYPEHDLEDDILFQKADIHHSRKNYDLALDLYTKVYTDFNEEIRADNALMKAAEIYEYELEEPEKAKELYEKLYLDFSNSTFAVEARKRFRLLRGDDV